MLALGKPKERRQSAPIAATLDVTATRDRWAAAIAARAERGS
jgi:hypothetical protein